MSSNLQLNPTNEIFLESHNIDNQYFGFGQFNYHLIKALASFESSRKYTPVLHSKNPKKWRAEFGTSFEYKKYYSLRRYQELRIRKKYKLWHSMNQNTKIEPYHDIPYFLTVHNITYIKDGSNYKEKEVHKRFQEKLNRSDFISYISEYARESTHKYFDVPSVPEQVIYNGNCLAEIDQENQESLNIEQPYFFSIGQITDRKNFITLVRLLHRFEKYNLVIAGKKSTETAQRLIEEAKKIGVDDRLILLGKVSEAQKISLYKHCSAFLFPSLREGFGLPVVEAMTFGKPVFVSNNTSLPEVGGEHAFYWDHYDTEYMGQVLTDGLKVFNEQKEKLSKIYKAHASKFNWKHAAKQYHEIYESFI